MVTNNWIFGQKMFLCTVCKKLKVSLPLLPFINWWFVQVGSTSSQKMEAFWVVRESTEEKVKSYFCIWQDRIIFFSVATFHLQDNKYPKSNFSRTFFLCCALLLLSTAIQLPMTLCNNSQLKWKMVDIELTAQIMHSPTVNYIWNWSGTILKFNFGKP